MEFLQFMEPWMIPIVIMICVTIIVALSVIGNIITTSMKKKDGGNLSENKEFLNALRDFKENMDQRVSNLEDAFLAEKKSSPSLKSGRDKSKMQSAIDLELDDESPREEKTNDSTKLRNMLNK